MPRPFDATAPAAGIHLLTVVGARNLTGRMRRVTVEAPSLPGFTPWPGQDVVLHLSASAGAGVSRRYTVRHFDPAAGRFGLDFVMHGDGPGARWAENAQPGDEIEIFGPRGKVAVSEAAWQLFTGDESALPAIAEMIEALPAGVTATAFLEVSDAGEEQPIDAAVRPGIRWLHRGQTPAGTSDLLDRAVAEIAAVGVPASDRHVFLFGESRTVRRLRDIVSRGGVRPEEISAKGYWNLGRGARP